MENTVATADGNFRSGRYNPQFSQQVASLMINPFVKYRGVELFATYEIAKGRTIVEPEQRTARQYGVDVIYRFPAAREQFWVAGRYNSLSAEMPANPQEVKIDRVVASAGWFLTRNIMLKGEYVSQLYKDFAPTDIRSGGGFDGFMMEAVVGF
jgi:hypothetical protein